MTIIKPTVGRIVLYVPFVSGAHDQGLPDHDRNMARNGNQPLPAIVTMVHEDSDTEEGDFVNLTVFDTMGVSHGRQDVRLVQDSDEVPEDGAYCEWMPYQKGQAAKYEESEAKRLAQAGDPFIDIHKKR